MREKLTGETLTITVGIAGEVTSLDGANIVFKAIHKESGRVIDKEPIIDGLTISATLESTETLMPGIYSCEFRGLFSGITKSIYKEDTLFKTGVIKEVITNG